MLRHIFSSQHLDKATGVIQNSHASQTTQRLVEISGLVKVYSTPGGSVTALKGISLNVKSGEFLVVTGKSGSGKTTLVNMITGLDHCSEGEVWVLGAPLHRFKADRLACWRRRSVGVVFQTFELLPTLTILQNVTLPMDFAHCYSLRQRQEKAVHLLDQVGIAEHARKLPTELSGGQQQRVAIARALANNPPLIVADEPTGSLDSHTAIAIINIFRSLVEEGRTVIMVSHDQDIARRADRSLELLDGEIVA